MQTKKTRTETTSETLTVLIIRRSNTGTRVFWCERCNAEVLWITPRAIKLFGNFDLPKGEAVYTIGEEICSRSLIEEIKKGDKKYEEDFTFNHWNTRRFGGDNGANTD